MNARELLIHQVGGAGPVVPSKPGKPGHRPLVTRAAPAPRPPAESLPPHGMVDGAVHHAPALFHDADDRRVSVLSCGTNLPHSEAGSSAVTLCHVQCPPPSPARGSDKHTAPGPPLWGPGFVSTPHGGHELPQRNCPWSARSTGTHRLASPPSAVWSLLLPACPDHLWRFHRTLSTLSPNQ